MWDRTPLFIIAKDLKVANKFTTLSKAAIGSVYSAFNTQDQRINQVQTYVTNLINNSSKRDAAVTEMSHAINQIQSNTAPLAAASQSPTKIQKLF